MTVYIANFGVGNSLWPHCLSKSMICSYEDADLWPLWEAGKVDEYIEKCLKEKKTAKGISPTKPVASRWYNIGHIVSETQGDLWIHREKDEVWWTISLPSKVQVERRNGAAVGRKEDHFYVLNKPAAPWQNKSKNGRPLNWRELHPKAREFLFTEGTMQRLADENAEYAKALIDGGDLKPWHSMSAWLSKEEKAKRGDCRSLSPIEVAVARMAETAENTAAIANGQQVSRNVKNKEFRFHNRLALEKYLAALIEAQDGACAITSIPFQYDTVADAPELLPSLDRIDSDGHYEEGNLQVVCRFINRWKNDSLDLEFRRLIHLVRTPFL